MAPSNPCLIWWMCSFLHSRIASQSLVKLEKKSFWKQEEFPHVSQSQDLFFLFNFNTSFPPPKSYPTNQSWQRPWKHLPNGRCKDSMHLFCRDTQSGSNKPMIVTSITLKKELLVNIFQPTPITWHCDVFYPRCKLHLWWQTFQEQVSESLGTCFFEAEHTFCQVGWCKVRINIWFIEDTWKTRESFDIALKNDSQDHWIPLATDQSRKHRYYTPACKAFWLFRAQSSYRAVAWNEATNNTKKKIWKYSPSKTWDLGMDHYQPGHQPPNKTSSAHASMLQPPQLANAVDST